MVARVPTSRSNDFDSITITFERVDLGPGDTVKVFDGRNELLLELKQVRWENQNIDEMPLEATRIRGFL